MSGFALPLLTGVAFALVTIGMLRVTGMDRDRASAPITLIAIALFYVVFAVENGNVSDFAVHAAIAVIFVAFAALGYRHSLAIVGVAMIGHGLFDVAMSFVTGNPAPLWWAPFCLGVDVVLGVWLLTFRPWERSART